MMYKVSGILSCLVELFTDKRAPEIGRCYQVDNRIKKAYLRTEPMETIYFIAGRLVKGCAIDPTATGTLLVIKFHGVNGPVWNQWVQCIYCNDKDVQYKGWLPRWEFIQMVVPRDNKNYG